MPRTATDATAPPPPLPPPPRPRLLPSTPHCRQRCLSAERPAAPRRKRSPLRRRRRGPRPRTTRMAPPPQATATARCSSATCAAGQSRMYRSWNTLRCVTSPRMIAISAGERRQGGLAHAASSRVEKWRAAFCASRFLCSACTFAAALLRAASPHVRGATRVSATSTW